jgi:hypothetical protein
MLAWAAQTLAKIMLGMAIRALVFWWVAYCLIRTLAFLNVLGRMDCG